MGKPTTRTETMYYAGRLDAASMRHIQQKCVQYTAPNTTAPLFKDMSSMARDRYGAAYFRWYVGSATTTYRTLDLPQDPEGLTMISDTVVIEPRFVGLSTPGGGGVLVHIATGWAVAASGLYDLPTTLKLIQECDFSEPEIRTDENGQPFAYWTANEGRTTQRHYWHFDLHATATPITARDPGSEFATVIADAAVRVIDHRWGLSIMAVPEGYACYNAWGARLFTVPLTASATARRTGSKWDTAGPQELAAYHRDNLLWAYPDLGRQPLPPACLKQAERTGLDVAIKVMRDVGIDVGIDVANWLK